MNEKIERLKQKGFIAALDQSGESTERALNNYGINPKRYETKKDKQNLIHQMRKRVMTNKYFDGSKIIGVILFKEEIEKKIENEFTPDYLWNKKGIISFVKIDEGLLEKEDGVCLMKDIDKLNQKLKFAKSRGIIGTKMRSVIYENNEKGIKNVISQQLKLAKLIYSSGLIPIVEPEININAKDKEQCEQTLIKELDSQMTNLDIKMMLKLTLPEVPNTYEKYTKNPKILKVTTLSGGYERNYACEKLSKNKNIIASFSKALLQDLKENQTEIEFTETLKKSINQIYKSSIT